ncbi:hypothetical protein FA95DRAFT_1612513 [Auriscalpium vulgare]|uniref:Uncharacterized protein n=1 Tax=Auriscalpium vulgare TaxID=40419 RepID=A0ACB8R6D3_9AGAM|nr:hypothetical protein FA95DRAFT_1612513 [Auriscalpium vulgare]
MATGDTLQDVDVVISGHGTVDVVFRPADSGVGTHIRFLSTPRDGPNPTPAGNGTHAVAIDVREVASADPPATASPGAAPPSQPIATDPAPIVHPAPSAPAASPADAPMQFDRADSPSPQPRNDVLESDAAQDSAHHAQDSEREGQQNYGDGTYSNDAHDSAHDAQDSEREDEQVYGDGTMMMVPMSQMAQIMMGRLDDSEVARRGLPPGIYVDFEPPSQEDEGSNSNASDPQPPPSQTANGPSRKRARRVRRGRGY